jgi:multidrug efflux pump
VFSLIIIAFGLIAFTRLPLRELPDVDRPVVSVNASYPGASAQVVENQITRVIEDQLSGIDGIDVINSASRDGRSSINIEFTLDRDEDATNDVRNAVSRARGQLPADIDEPVIARPTRMQIRSSGSAFNPPHSTAWRSPTTRIAMLSIALPS